MKNVIRFLFWALVLVWVVLRIAHAQGSPITQIYVLNCPNAKQGSTTAPFPNCSPAATFVLPTSTSVIVAGGGGTWVAYAGISGSLYACPIGSFITNSGQSCVNSSGKIASSFLPKGSVPIVTPPTGNVAVLMSCTAATTFTNGATIPSGTVVTFNFYGGPSGSSQLLLNAAPLASCSFIQGNIPALQSYCVAATQIVAGIESGPSNQACFVPANPSATTPASPGAPAIKLTTQSTAPYPQSSFIVGMSADFKTVQSMRSAIGSDLWPTTWGPVAAPNNGALIAAWGDGGGFGGSNTIGRTSLGFASLSGFPVPYNPASVAGVNIWGQAPMYAQNQATFGGKSDDLISIAGTIYAQGGFWTQANCGCANPTLKDGDNPTERTIITSANFGASWSMPTWVRASDDGTSLQMGPDYSQAFDPANIYLYYQGNVNTDPTHFYLRRVAVANRALDPATVTNYYQYYTGTASGVMQWSSSASAAAPIFTDPNIKPGIYACCGIVYDSALQRYILSENFGPNTGQMGFFESAAPQGPWATIGYFDDWGGLNESAGPSTSFGFTQKWVSSDGKTLWGIFSGTNVSNSGPDEFDSFNLISVILQTAS